jgi:GNAT superfamily N-acetyltransferase
MRYTTKTHLTIKPIETSNTHLPEVISPSIGLVTKQKLHRVLTSYNTPKHHLLGAFIGEILIGVIGIEITKETGIIKHIAVLAEHRMKGIGKKLIIYSISYFLLEHLTAETDDDSIEFYKKCNFQCNSYKGHYCKRYHCVLNINKKTEFKN